MLWVGDRGYSAPTLGPPQFCTAVRGEGLRIPYRGCRSPQKARGPRGVQDPEPGTLEKEGKQ